MSIGDVFKGIAAGGLIVAGALTGNVGLVLGGAGLMASTAMGALSTADRQRGVQQETAGTEESLVVVYGEGRVGANLYETRVDPDSEDRRFLARGAAVCLGSQDGRGIFDIEQILINGRLAVDQPLFRDAPQVQGIQDFWSGQLAYSAFSGTYDQVVPEDLANRFGSIWTSSHRGRGVAHVLLGAYFDKEVYTAGLPRAEFVVQGQRVFDPRDDKWRWSENPWLCALDLVLSRGYGKGAYQGLNSPRYWEQDAATEGSPPVEVARAFDDKPIAELGLSEGQAVSCGWDLKSVSGADRVRHRLVWKDSAGSTIRTDTSPTAESSVYRRREIEGVEVPAGTQTVSWIAENLDGSEGGLARRAEMLKRETALPFLNKVDLASFVEQANYADDEVTVNVGGTPVSKTRHTVGGFVDTADDVNTNLQMLAAAGRGDVIFEGGRFRATARKGSATVQDFTLSPDNIEGEWTVHRRSLQEAPNSIKVTYTDQEKEFQAGDVTWPETGDFALLDASQGHPADLEMSVPMVTDAVTAKQIAMVTLRELHQDAIIEATAGHEALQLQTNDLITVDLPTEGFEGKKFWVVGMQIRPSYKVDLVLHEFDASAYDLRDQEAEATVPSPDLPDPFSLDPVSNVAVVSDQSTQQITAAGDKIPRIRATWDPPADPFFDLVELAVRRTADADGNPVSEDFEQLEPVLAGEDQRKVITRGEVGETWEVKLTAVNTTGIRSSPVTQETVLSTDFAPGDPRTDVVPRVTFETLPSRSLNPVIQPIKIDAIAGADASPGAGDLEVDWRLMEEGVLIEDWHGFASAPITPDVVRGVLRKRTLIAKARDTSVAGSPESDHQTMIIQPFLDLPDFPDLIRSPIDEEGTRSGRGGETPGRETFRGPMRSRDGAESLVDSRTGRMGTGLSGPTGQRSATDIEDGAGRGIEGLTSIGNISPLTRVGGDDGRASDPVSRQTGEQEQNLLGRDAAPEHCRTFSGPGWFYRYLTREPIADLGLEVGDRISLSVFCKTDGTIGGRPLIQFRDSSGSVVGSEGGAFQYNETYERRVVEDVEIPAGTAEISVGYDNENSDPEGQGCSKRAILTKGPVAQSFGEPPVRSRRETAADLFRTDGADLDSILRALSAGGKATDRFHQETGGEIKEIMRGVLTGRAADGADVDFTEVYDGGFDSQPIVLIFGGPTFVPDDGSGNFGTGTYQWPVKEASGLDELGFTMKAIMQDRASTEDKTQTYPSGALTLNGDALSLAGRTEGQTGGSGLSATAHDGFYESTYAGTVTAEADEKSGEFDFASVTVTVTVHLDVWDNDAGSPSWVEADSKSHSVLATNGDTNSGSFSGTLSFTSGLIDVGDDVRTRITIDVDGDGSGSASVDPANVLYTAATVIETTMSPNGERLRWLAFEAP